MRISDFFTCCISETTNPKEEKLLRVYTDKSLKANQKCIIDEKTTATTVCNTILKTEEFLKTKFGQATKNYSLLPGKGEMSLLLLSRRDYRHYSTRILNKFELPLNLRKNKPSDYEYFFLVMRRDEIQEIQNNKRSPLSSDVSRMTEILEKGKLYKKNGVGEFKEKYFVLTKQVLLFLDLTHKKKKMHILELDKIQFGNTHSSWESDFFELKTPKKIYYLMANNRNDLNFWREKIQLQISMVSQNLVIEELEKKIKREQEDFHEKISTITYKSFEGIEHLLSHTFLREWFFKYITSNSPEESGILLLIELQSKFKLAIQKLNFREAYKNLSRIYEIINKVADDWEKKTLSPMQVKVEPSEEPQKLLRRSNNTGIMLNLVAMEEQGKKKMYYTRNNSPYMEQKKARPVKKNPVKSQAPSSNILKHPLKDQINVRFKFQQPSQNAQKQEIESILTHTSIFKSPMPKIEESDEKELIFHDEFFIKIFNDFDWRECQKKFLYIQEIYHKEHVDSQLTDIFSDLFEKLIKYLERNYYISFLESDFYLRNLLFSLIEKTKQRSKFQKPTFLTQRQSQIKIINQSSSLLRNENTEKQENVSILKGIIGRKRIVSSIHVNELLKNSSEENLQSEDENDKKALVEKVPKKVKFEENKENEEVGQGEKIRSFLD